LVLGTGDESNLDVSLTESWSTDLEEELSGTKELFRKEWIASKQKKEMNEGDSRGL
jgi:hypothetical protein